MSTNPKTKQLGGIIYNILLTLYDMDMKYFRRGKYLEELSTARKIATYNIVQNEYQIMKFVKHSVMFINFWFIKPQGIPPRLDRKPIFKLVEEMILMDKTNKYIHSSSGDSNLRDILAQFVSILDKMFSSRKKLMKLLTWKKDKSKNKGDEYIDTLIVTLNELLVGARVALINLNMIGLGHVAMEHKFNELNVYIDNQCKELVVMSIVSDYYRFIKEAA